MTMTAQDFDFGAALLLQTASVVLIVVGVGSLALLIGYRLGRRSKNASGD
jgi:hypothetical protein